MKAKAIGVMAAAGVVAGAFGALETLTVPQGETVVRGAAYRNTTNTALTVSGTLDLAVGGKYVLCAVNADGSYDATSKPTMLLAPNAGDEGVLNITNGTQLGTQVGVTFASHLTVGGAGGGAQARINIGVDGTGQRASYRLDTLRLSAQAQTPAAAFPLIDIGCNASLELLCLRNETAKPLVVAFTNDVDAAAQRTAAADAGLRQFYSSSPFAPSTQAGGDIVLRGEARAPIRLNSWGGKPWNFFRDASAKASLVTEGACDVVVRCPSEGASINLTNVVWRHTGDFVVAAQDDGALFRLKCRDVLPWGPRTGLVRVQSHAKGGAQTLDLNGHDQRLNGLVLDAAARVANVADGGAAATPAVLTFGAGDVDGLLSGAVEDATVACVKEGAGTLVLSNATVRALTVTNGVLRIAPGTVNAIGTLALTNATLSVALDAQLEVGTLLRADDVVDAVAIRARATNETTVASRTLYPFTCIEKTGAAFHTMTLPPQANGASLRVRDGVLRLGGDVCTNAYWRFVAKKASIAQRTDTKNGRTLVSTLFLGTLGLFTPSGLPSLADKLGVTGVAAAGSVADLAALPEGRVTSRRPWAAWSPDIGKTYFGTDGDPVLTGGSASHPLWFLHAGGAAAANGYDSDTRSDMLYWYGAVMFTNGVLKADDAATWETIAWRVDGAARQPVVSYGLRRGVNMTCASHPCPSDWALETSADGVTWTTLDERADERAWEKYAAGSSGLDAQCAFTYNNHIPYLFSARRAAWKFLDFGDVRVDAGATLDLGELLEENVAFNRLTVDCAGAGAVTMFRPAANGRLDVVSGTGAEGLPGRLVLPLALGKVVDGGNLASWTVYVDGAPARASAVGAEDGRLVVTTRNGTVLMLR